MCIRGPPDSRGAWHGVDCLTMAELNPSSPRRGRKTTLRPPELLHQTDQERDAPPDISSEEIARRAYARWEESDRGDGRDQEHWYAAEQELRRSPSRRPREGEDMDVSELDEVG